MAFTEQEREYLAAQHLGRIATTSAAGEPDVAPVAFSVAQDGTISIGGLDNPATIKWRNVEATGRAAFVVDDLATVDPWRPRGLKVKGAAAAVVTDEGRKVIVITPETVWSWGLNPAAPKHFGGMIEKRPFADPA
jgi:pyridoxamine 5'-phosphate oxidase family protein